MPAYILSAQSVSGSRPDRVPGKQSTGISPDCSRLSFSGVFVYLASSLERLLAASIAVTIFMVLPPCESTAEMNLPGMQFSAARTGNFDRKESVLDRFRAFSGKKSPTALENLFTRWDSVFSQNPAVLLSDGTTVARVTLRLQGRGGDPPKFSLSGGHCVSAKMTGNGIWLLEILPNRGSLATSLTVAFSGQMTEYPLTVAPPLDLFEPKHADKAVLDYVTTANRLAAPGTVPGRK